MFCNTVIICNEPDYPISEQNPVIICFNSIRPGLNGLQIP